MANTTLSFVNRFDEAIKCAIKEEIATVTRQAIKEAQDKIDKQIRDNIDKMVLRLAKEYSVQDMGTHLIIHVKKGI